MTSNSRRRFLQTVASSAGAAAALTALPESIRNALAFDVIRPVVMGYYNFMVFGKAAGGNKSAAIAGRTVIAAAGLSFVH